MFAIILVDLLILESCYKTGTKWSMRQSKRYAVVVYLYGARNRSCILFGCCLSSKWKVKS